MMYPDGWNDEPGGPTMSYMVEYEDCHQLIGKAHFNFNPKYQKNSSVPKGKADFKLGDMKFDSTSLDWLVVNGSKAQLKGQVEPSTGLASMAL